MKYNISSLQFENRGERSKVVGVLCAGAGGLRIEGAPPGRARQFLYDLELKPGVGPPPAPQPAKLGPGKTEQEHHHLKRDLGIGHLYVGVYEARGHVRVVFSSR